MYYVYYNGSSWGTPIQVDTAKALGVSLKFDTSDNPRIAFYNFYSGDLEYAIYTGSGSESTCTHNNWACTTIDSTNTVGLFPSMDLNDSNNPGILYKYSNTADLRYAWYVGGGGGSGCASSDWSCEDVYTTNNIGNDNVLKFDSNNVPHIVSNDIKGSISKIFLPELKRSLDFDLLHAAIIRLSFNI